MWRADSPASLEVDMEEIAYEPVKPREEDEEEEDAAQTDDTGRFSRQAVA